MIFRPFHLILEEKVIQKAKDTSGIIRFRLWQPKHNSEDQWAIDNFFVKRAIEIIALQADFTVIVVIVFW